ncbi:MAG: SGNH/GDSL hydrolase family protein [Candidatus Lernaella stagnicola]|nr:SGNH/GDSL hydrolase family protein [Candidatus Lernaella stagnicola]
MSRRRKTVLILLAVLAAWGFVYGLTQDLALAPYPLAAGETLALDTAGAALKIILRTANPEGLHLKCLSKQGEAIYRPARSDYPLFANDQYVTLEVLPRESGILFALNGGALSRREEHGRPERCYLTAGLAEVAVRDVGRAADVRDKRVAMWLLMLVVAAAWFWMESRLVGRLQVDRGRWLTSLVLSALAVGCWLSLAGACLWLPTLHPLALALFAASRVAFWLVAGGSFREPSGGTRRYVLGGVGLLGFVLCCGALIAYASPRIGIAALLLTAALGFDVAFQLDWRKGRWLAATALLLAPFAVIAVLSTQKPPVGPYALWGLLPAGVALLAVPLAANRDRLGHYGWLRLAHAVLFLFVLDGALRLSPAANYVKPAGIGADYQTHEDLFWVPKRFFGYEQDSDDRGDFRVPRVRFRGDEDATRQKPQGTARIIVTGGSNAWGDGQPTPETAFSALLEQDLQAKTGRQVEVLNGGVRGFLVFQVMVLTTEYLLQYNPDILIVYAARNDVLEHKGLQTYRELWRRKQAGETSSAPTIQGVLRGSALYNGLTALIVQWRDGGLRWYEPARWKPVNPPEDFAANLRDIIHAAKSRGCRVVLASEFFGEHFFYDIEMPRLRELQQNMKQVAKTEKAPFFDAWTLFHETGKPRSYLMADDPVHINAAGHALLARHLADYLVSDPSTSGVLLAAEPLK